VYRIAIPLNRTPLTHDANGVASTGGGVVVVVGRGRVVGGGSGGSSPPPPHPWTGHMAMGCGGCAPAATAVPPVSRPAATAAMRARRIGDVSWGSGRRCRPAEQRRAALLEHRDGGLPRCPQGNHWKRPESIRPAVEAHRQVAEAADDVARARHRLARESPDAVPLDVLQVAPRCRVFVDVDGVPSPIQSRDEAA
jgi:hypothetical protein